VTTSRLPRRAIVGTVLATSLIGASALAFAAGEGGGLGLPTKDCNTVTDPKGDGNVGSQEGLPGSFPNDPDLDITGLVFGSNDKAVTAYVRIDKLDTRSAYGDGHAFSASFTANGKAVQFTTFRFAAGQVNDAMASLPAPLTLSSSYVNLAGNPTDVPFTATYDTTNSMVILSADRPALEKAIGGPLGTISKISAESATDIADVSEPADEVDGKDTTWTADANTCFGAAPAPAPVESAAPSAAPSPSAPPAAPVGAAPAGLPTPDCSLAKDPKGDALFEGKAPNDPDLDMTSVTIGTDAKNLTAYIKVDQLSDSPMFSDGHRFYVSFTFNKHSFTMAGSNFANGEGAIRDGGSQTGQVAASTQLAVDGVTSSTDPGRFTGAGPGFVDSGLKFTFDTKNSYVIATLPIADLEKYGKAPSAGAVLSGVYANGNSDYVASAIVVDTVPDGATATAPGKLTYTVGDNHCFAPAAPAANPLTNVGAVTAQYGDTAAVAAKLVDPSGAPVAGKAVTFTLGSSKAVGTTGADGVAKAALLVKAKAGKSSLVLTSEDLTASVPFTVLLEKTVLKATNTKGAVTATLTDDDKTPVTGQVITFTLGSKKVTAKTDAKGVAKANGFPAGNVKVTYAGSPGMYTAASASAKS
jgi:hypothetical protein